MVAAPLFLVTNGGASVVEATDAVCDTFIGDKTASSSG